MKIKIDIECSPKEARDFLGLPDVAPMQDRLLEAIEERMKSSVKTLDGGELWKSWMPLATALGGGAEGLERFQRLFWPLAGDAATNQTGSRSGPAKTKSPKDEEAS
ncbi:MAG: DUF6489 family protein [Rhodospirillales bacterium]